MLAAHRSRSEEHTSELQSRRDLVCRLLLEKKKCALNRLGCCIEVLALSAATNVGCPHLLNVVSGKRRVRVASRLFCLLRCASATSRGWACGRTSLKFRESLVKQNVAEVGEGGIRQALILARQGAFQRGFGLAQLAGAQLFFFNDTATTEIYTLSLHDALPI